MTVAEKHTLGNPIVTTLSGEAAPSWDLALTYASAYFLAIWKAMLVALILASLMKVVIPKNWMQRVVGQDGYLSTLKGGFLALPAMMCTCCAAPVVAAMRQKNSSVGAAVAFWLGNTALNPAVLVFMFFVLGWKFTLLRLVVGVIFVFGLSYIANRIAKNVQVDSSLLVDETEEAGAHPFVEWVKTFVKLAITIIPVHFATVLVLGAAQAWLFPSAGAAEMNSVWLIVAMAIVGTFFVIPTAAEIAIAAAVLSSGLGTGPAAALMVTLPVVSLPAIFMLRKAFPAKVIAFLTVSVMMIGILAGLVATAF
ncbi:permease [Brevibacillus sp. SYP-B805]|uniref:permease n=1 Tax=Brevibacillus sp. SYP-B805 TaxID=1578199 RepID=UPI001F49F5F4|nr:permease [Brevibacillus sp. SYP-B805]